jgi:hypothetical protein
MTKIQFFKKKVNKNKQKQNSKLNDVKQFSLSMKARFSIFISPTPRPTPDTTLCLSRHLEFLNPHQPPEAHPTNSSVLL